MPLHWAAHRKGPAALEGRNAPAALEGCPCTLRSSHTDRTGKSYSISQVRTDRGPSASVLFLKMCPLSHREYPFKTSSSRRNSTPITVKANSLFPALLTQLKWPAPALCVPGSQPCGATSAGLSTHARSVLSLHSTVCWYVIPPEPHARLLPSPELFLPITATYTSITLGTL